MATPSKAPTPEEILSKYITKRNLSPVQWDGSIQAIQEYAEAYHKEKLREELIKFLTWYHPPAAQTEPVIDRYLKPKP